MSAALVRKSLGLFEEDHVSNDGKQKKKQKQQGKGQRGVQKLHDTQHRDQRQIGRRKKNASRMKSAKRKDFTSDNLHLLQRLSEAAKADVTHTVKVFGRKETPEPTVTSPEEPSLFTDADFEKFANEYNFKADKG